MIRSADAVHVGRQQRERPLGATERAPCVEALDEAIVLARHVRRLADRLAGGERVPRREIEHIERRISQPSGGGC